MPATLLADKLLTIEAFLAFTGTRPDGERWELIEGRPVMSPSPTDWHQRIVLTISAALDAAKLASNAPWMPILGIGTRVPISPNSLPQPDVFVKEGPMTGRPITDDALVLFEVLSKSNTRADQAWRKRVYASIPNCQHYVTVATKSAEVVRHDRANSWKGTSMKGLNATLALPAIGVTIPLRDIYRWTPIV